MAAAFSRLQLAAALLEYDNDTANPGAEIRSAADSAIFAQFRRNERPRSTMSRKSADYLGVALPSEKGSLGARDSAVIDTAEARRSRSSIDMLRNPFGATEEDFLEEEPLDVDLESWGLNNLLTTKNKGKQPEKKASLPNPYDLQSVQGPHRPTPGARALSMGNFDDFGAGGAFLDAHSSLSPTHHGEASRTRSLGSALDMVDAAAFQSPIPRGRRHSAHALIDNLPVTPPLHAIPFPSSKSPSAMGDVPDNRSSYFDPQPHQRTQSTASMGSKMFLNDEPTSSTDPERRSRFDSHGNRIRTIAAMAPSATSGVDEDNPFAVRPPSPSRSSRFDPKAAAHARTMSNASLGSRLILDDAATGGTGYHSRERYSRLDMLRPKVLIMPSPLQGTMRPKPEPKVREGFHVTTDGAPPLPPGAKSTTSKAAPIQDAFAFTPNSQSSLSLAQLTFRSALYDNEREPSYSDLETRLRRATEEGEQVQEPESPVETDIPVIDVHMDESRRNPRGPGKLFGRSLIDDLENRKAEIRGKKRVFRGDERPSMMARASTQNSTFIDPTALQRPGSQRMDSSNSGASLGRRKTLLNFEDAENPTQPQSRKSQLALGSRASNVKTVFGTDTLWEREMEKLRAMEAAERAEAGLSEEPERSPASPLDKENHVPSSAPKLPDIRTAINRGPPPPMTGDDEDSDSDASEAQKPSKKKQNDDGEWFSDEENAQAKAAGPVRTIGSGPRYPKGKEREVASHPDDEDSEEDLPLAATVNRAVQRATRLGMGDEDDSDEDRPLTTLIEKTKLKLPPVNFDSHQADDEDEDDKPLGLRASHVGGDEDDVPLAFHPDQQRRTQYQMMAQQQQQQQQQFAQQQMMMQAQFQNSMMFAQPSMMGSGFFGPPMAPMMNGGPMPTPMTPPPVKEANKFVMVDQWRRDVVVEGEP